MPKQFMHASDYNTGSNVPRPAWAHHTERFPQTGGNLYYVRSGYHLAECSGAVHAKQRAAGIEPSQVPYSERRCSVCTPSTWGVVAVKEGGAEPRAAKPRKLVVGGSDRKRLQAELAEHLRAKDSATMREIRARIHSAKVNRRHLLTGAREQCRTARLALRDQQKQEREWFRDEQRGARAKGKTACETGKATAKKTGAELEQQTKAELRAERTLQRQVRAADQRGVKQRSTKRERSQEDDDAVRRNLPSELVPVFDAVKKRIKAGPRRSRTEAFLEWAEENPGEIVALQEEQAEAYLSDLLRKQREHGVSMRKAGRYKASPEELRELLAGVPF